MVEAVTMFRSTGNVYGTFVFSMCVHSNSHLDELGSKGIIRAPAWLSYFILLAFVLSWIITITSLKSKFEKKKNSSSLLFCYGVSVSKILRSVWWHEIYLKWIAFDLVICCLDLKLHLTHHFPCQKMYQYSPQQQIPQGKGMYLFTLSTG